MNAPRMSCGREGRVSRLKLGLQICRPASSALEGASDASEDRMDLPAVGIRLVHKSSMIENLGRIEQGGLRGRTEYA